MYRAIKYSVDVAITLAGSIMILPLSAVVALSLWLTQEKVLFRQRRPGLRGKPFTLYKFCTMTNAQDKNGNLLPDEQRITKIGALVRNLSLDELPQFWNVIKGEMSLVGPRPLLMEYLTRYTPEEARRHDVTPGITGWAQVNGRNAISWESKFALDVWYVDHASFFLDFRILWMTCLRVIRRSGISSQGHATMPQFMGKNIEN